MAELNVLADNMHLETTQKNYPEKLPRRTTQKLSDIQARILNYLRHNPKANRGAI